MFRFTFCLGTMLLSVAAPRFEGTHWSQVPIWISDAPDPYPATLTVSGMSGELMYMEVHLRGLSHENPENIDMVLESPQGTTVMLMSDVGGSSATFDIDLDLTDGAPPMSGVVLRPGTFSPTNFAPHETLPHPAPGSPYGSKLFEFEGEEVNGQWRLWVYDDYYFDYGSLEEWGLTLVTGPEPVE